MLCAPAATVKNSIVCSPAELLTVTAQVMSNQGVMGVA